MHGYFRSKWMALIVGVIAISLNPETTYAQGSPTPLFFEDGLGMTLPVGWKTTVLHTAPAPANQPANFTNPDTLTLLAYAQPSDESRTAKFTILRDHSFGGQVGPRAFTEAQVRLNEIAQVQGYRAEKFSQKGQIDSPNNILLVEIDGVGSDGSHRNFICVAINRFPEASLRGYWEYDARDIAAKLEFDAWFASVNFNGVKVADVLAGSATMIAKGSAQPQPSTDPAMSVAHVTPIPGNGTMAPTVLQTTEPNPTPAIPSQASGEMVSKNRTALVVIKGDKGTGSGFVCTLDGEPWLLTNTHVLGDNPRPRFTSIGGTAITPGPAFLAVDHDICKIKMPPGTQAIETMTEMESNAKIGDSIIVVGNAEGAGVVRPFEGHIVGLGPNLIEVDAPFVSGNSGSPIIHVASGKVIGIATYLVTRKVDTKAKGSIETQVRRFGYRIDNVKKWEAVNWNLFYSQSAQAAQIEATGNEFLQLFADARAKKLFASTYTNVGIQRALDNFARRLKGGNVSESDINFARRELLSNLRVTSLADVRAFDSSKAYDYFRREVANESRFRDEIYTGFTQSLNSAQP